MKTSLLEKAKWLWIDDNQRAYHRYVRFAKSFHLDERASDNNKAHLDITADAFYQVWLNGQMIGHGPAKSAEGKRSVDRYEVASLLESGDNRLEILVLSVGVGMMTYCPDDAGVIFDLDLNGHHVVSDATVLVREEATRTKATVRRWFLPCLEDVDAGAESSPWRRAKVVDKQVELYQRRVPLPTRESLLPRRVVSVDRVRFPNFSDSFYIKPYIVSLEERDRCNAFEPHAYIVTDLVSPVNQTLELVPTLGSVTWYYRGDEVSADDRWQEWPTTHGGSIRLKAGSNRFVGVCSHSHFTDACLAGFVKKPITLVNPFGQGAFQVVPLGLDKPVRGHATEHIDWESLQSQMPNMDPAHSMPCANAFALTRNARVVRADEPASLQKTAAGESFELPGLSRGHATRMIVDLGVLHNGYLAFDVTGQRDSELIFNFFEYFDDGPPKRIQWSIGCNNALTYHLRGGFDSFESFLPYGVRYVAIHHRGSKPVQVRNLRVLTANCGSRRQGYLLTPDSQINSIYEIATQTVISSLDDTYTDCPTFEQVNWNFDNRTAAMGEMLSCANDAVTRNSIKLFVEDSHPQFRGLVRSHYPSTWDNFIPLWSFHWLMWCEDYYQQTGDLRFLRSLFPRIKAGIEEALAKIDDRGLMAWSGVWHFVEWCSGRDDGHDIAAVEQAGLVAALASAVRMSKALGQDNHLRWQRARTSLIKAINCHLWDSQKKAYVDSLHADGQRSTVISQVTNAMMGVYRVAPPIQNKILRQRVLDNDPALLAYGSPYGLFYILEWLDANGDVEHIFDLIRDRWGDMLQDGDTTTWEHFAEGYQGYYPTSPWPTRSRCHPFAAYIIKYFVKYILGLECLSPGWKTFRVKPCPPKGMNRARGSIPTPFGLIRVSWHRRGSRIHTEVDHPRGTTHSR